jgi:hypothetical protein
MARPDPITYVIDWLMRHHPSISDDLALRAEAAARAEYGGESWAYIARQSQRQKAAIERAAHAAALRTSAPLEKVAQAHGLSRRTMYRLLKRGPAEV